MTQIRTDYRDLTHLSAIADSIGNKYPHVRRRTSDDKRRHAPEPKVRLRASNLENASPGAPPRRSRAIRSLVDRGFLAHADGPRSYRIKLVRGPIAAPLIRQLDSLGYLPKMLADD